MTASTLATGLRRTSLDTADSPAGVAWHLAPLSEVPADWSAVGSTPIPATVPGEVVADLLAAELIPDPFDGDNEDRLHWIGSTDWSYRTAFTFAPGTEQRHDLVFAGLDTIATVVLNGTEVGRTANQHRSHRFDVTDLLVPATTTSRSASRVRSARPSGCRPSWASVRGRTRTRSTPSARWPRATAGTGAPISPGPASGARSRSSRGAGCGWPSVRPLALVEGTSGRLETHVELEWADDGRLRRSRSRSRPGDRTVTAEATPGQTAVVLELTVPEVELWWPRGYGDQTRYDVTVRVADQSFEAAVGFRTAELRTTPDAYGNGFAVVVNGTPVYVKGFNWIPDDALITRLTPQTYRASIMEAVDAGINLLRVWGGGIYESDDFYDVCDELGVLVWQDFLFACAAYSEDEPLRSEVEAEAREAVTRLRPHPAWWCGTATTRTSGATSSGAGGRSWPVGAGATATTPSCCRPSWPSSTRGRRTRPAARSPTPTTTTRTTRARHHAHLGRLEPAATTRSTASTSPGSSPSSASRDRPRGRP